jgi:glutathione synthase/RimK-type ligase-like ATP-grasp enzyme
MRQIAFLSMDSLDEFVSYDQLVIDRLKDLGIHTTEVSWRTTTPAWDQYELVVIRTPWDYQKDAEKFLQVLEEIERSSARLLNSLETVRWNIRKTYLQDLEARGVQVIPTLWLQSPSAAELASLGQRWTTDGFVVKPVVGANADNAYRCSSTTPMRVFQDAERAFSGQIALAQPFVKSVTETGEFSLIYFNGAYSHTVLKRPKQGDFRVQEEHGGQVVACHPEADIRALGAACMKALPFETLYGRADIVRLDDGTPAIMELELIEPSLYVSFDGAAADRFARAIAGELH